MHLRHVNVAATGSAKVAEANGGAIFWNVNINKTAASAVLKVYNNTSAVAADLVCTIDCATTIGSLWYAIYCPKGIFYDLSGGNADVTIGFS
jgi:hypothetical protein